MHIIFMMIVRHATVVKPFQETRQRRGSGSSKIFIFSPLLNTHVLHHMVNFIIYPLRHDTFSKFLQWVGHMGALKTRIWALSSDSLVFKDKQEIHHKTIWIAVQLLSCVWFFATPWTAASQASVSFPYLPEFAQSHVHWVSDAISPSHPLSPPLLLPQSFPSSGSLHQIAEVLVLQL